MSFAALVLRARSANDITRAQINNIPSKSHVIPLLSYIVTVLDISETTNFDVTALTSYFDRA